MLYIGYHCNLCKVDVTAPACPEKVLNADAEVETRQVWCPKCKNPTDIELACRIKPIKKRGRPRKGSVPLVVPDVEPKPQQTKLPLTEDPEKKTGGSDLSEPPAS